MTKQYFTSGRLGKRATGVGIRHKTQTFLVVTITVNNVKLQQIYK